MGTAGIIGWSKCRTLGIVGKRTVSHSPIYLQPLNLNESHQRAGLFIQWEGARRSRCSCCYCLPGKAEAVYRYWHQLRPQRRSKTSL